MEDKILGDVNEQLDESERRSSEDAGDPIAELVVATEKVLDKTEELIRARPLESVLVGVGIGFLLGVLMRDD